MWLLRILLSIQENFGLWIIGILIAEGVFAFVMMFLFPLASIAMVFLGLLTLGLSIVAKALLGWSILLLCRLLKVTPPAPADPTNTAPA
ncbi:MAG: hypothetical protein MK095_04105 [Phycisphaerales bacterium]|nr:hypothetical protein [Phycisphaerales bacterium]